MVTTEHRPNWVPVDADESAVLIKASGGDKVYRAGFGSGGVAIDAARPENRWLLLLSARLRGVFEEDGSGI